MKKKHSRRAAKKENERARAKKRREEEKRSAEKRERDAHSRPPLLLLLMARAHVNLQSFGGREGENGQQRERGGKEKKRRRENERERERSTQLWRVSRTRGAAQATTENASGAGTQLEENSTCAQEKRIAISKPTFARGAGAGRPARPERTRAILVYAHRIGQASVLVHVHAHAARRVHPRTRAHTRAGTRTVTQERTERNGTGDKATGTPGVQRCCCWHVRRTTTRTRMYSTMHIRVLACRTDR